MKISSVRIEKFRSFEDTTIPLNDYACLVGPNGAGKSNVLTALNVFFRESENFPTDLIHSVIPAGPSPGPMMRGRGDASQ